MRLLIEELDKELPQGWVMLRRIPSTDPADGFIEMHFTGDVDLIAENAALKRVEVAAKAFCDMPNKTIDGADALEAYLELCALLEASHEG
jgi:hypothetical protein